MNRTAYLNPLRSAVVSAFIAFAFVASGCTTKKGEGVSARVRHDESVKQALAGEIADLQAQRDSVRSASEREILERRIRELEQKLNDKRFANALSYTNHQIMSDVMKSHTKLYSLKGKYKVLVIPVQFSDTKFARPEFFEAGANGKVPAQDYLFGDNPNSLTSYYKHASLGQLHVDGEIAAPVTAPGTLKDYGEAVAGAADVAARKLVVDALLDLRAKHTDADWWSEFDRWDLGDYDSDKNFYEPDGFIDAVVLIYAGKSQASCQRSFDPEGKRPPSAEVPPGPKQASAVECFNRIWPHRWGISIPANDPNFSGSGPVVEGFQRPSMNGLKINDQLFALDYNMQSEFSDLSTFMHEFGHSLTLPDVYANAGDNSTGSWELMSSNARLQAQELSTYSKLSLGWISPKIVKQGEKTSAYLGAYNFVSETQRERPSSYSGPSVLSELVDGKPHTHDVVSTTPEFGEPVYRSLIALPTPAVEKVKVVDMKAGTGRFAAYSNRFDGGSRALKLPLRVPEEGDATLRFDTIYHIETETNWAGNEEAIRIVTDYDLGSVLVNGQVLEDLRLVSGDTDYDTLADLNPQCDVTRTLELRLKRIAGDITANEKKELTERSQVCQAPIWVEKSYDLSALRGQDVELEIRLVTDAGYTEFGVVVDNIRLGSRMVTFEDASDRTLGEFSLLTDGNKEEANSQFYMFEYRTPGESYSLGGKDLSFNMDNHIRGGDQSMFLEGEGSPIDRFRMVQMEYQPGVLVWYFNSKFDRRSNNPERQDGNGYLLVLNSKVKEIKLPGVLSKPELLNANGEYDEESEAFKAFVKAQGDQFVCVSHTQYATYLNGEAPSCAEDEFKDVLQRMTFEGKPMRWRREAFNEYLPVDQYGFHSVGEPLRTAPGIRTALSTFRPADAGAFEPFRVYKAQGTRMVPDAELTALAEKYAPVSEFRDSDSVLPASKRFWGDSVVVEKKGFGFRVVSPSAKIAKSYSTEAPADANENFLRRPRAKIYFNWE